MMIEGREAIAVRAIPLLTYWEVLSPDALAHALTGRDPSSHSFSTLLAHQVSPDGIKSVPQVWWANFMLPQLNAVSERIKQTEVSPEVGYSDWQRESLEKLPAGTFLWRDEFEACFKREFGPNGHTLLLTDHRTGNEPISLDFDPFIPSKDVQSLVLEGFESFQTPHSLSDLPKIHEGSNSEKSLGTRERNTLLAIIGVLCRHGEFDYTTPAKTAVLIQDLAARMGISIGETTIEAHLKKIPNAIAGRMK